MNRLPCTNCSLESCKDCPHPIEEEARKFNLEEKLKKVGRVGSYKPMFNREAHEAKKRYY